MAMLRDIRKLMASEEGAQARLDRFVQIIARHMKVDVCSIYLTRQGDELELCATEGLRREAVHQTRLKVSEGLVGLVARTAEPLNLSDASKHPFFSYRPETGEDPFHGFLAVPILRGGRTLGVLVIQNKEFRQYGQEEMESLLTVAMILAEIVLSLPQSSENLKGIEVRASQPVTFPGKAFAGGLASGHAVLHLPPVAPSRLIAEDTKTEQGRLEKAISDLRQFVDAMVSGEAAGLTRASREIFETYRMFAYDRAWVDRLREAVQGGLTAEAAVERVRNEHRARLLKAKDPYLRARLHDLEDLANRMLRLLAGETLDAKGRELPKDAVLFARDIGPAELLEYDQSKLRGLVLEEGAPSSHTSIIARAFGIPLLGRADGVLDLVNDGDDVLLDGTRSEVHIRPVDSQIEAFHLRIISRGKRAEELEKLRDIPATTKDGHRIKLMLNSGLLIDLPHMDQTGADGIGLFRTEFQFMVSDRMPGLEEQTDLYRRALDAAGDRPVTFRTLDLGGDKILPYAQAVPEENPAIGWRAIRIGLDRPALLRYQLRALLAAAPGKVLKVMFPMVSTVDEFLEAKALFQKEIERAKRSGKTMPDRIETGIMLETPSLAWQIDAIAEVADFVSVGANDLMQFFFAADRGNARVADRYDILHPGALSLLKFIAEGCKVAGTPVSVCGEAAGRPTEAVALIALGFHALSMPVTGIGKVKRACLSLDAGALQEELLPLLTAKTAAASLRNVVESFCEGQNIPLS